jgi:phosphatidylglycerol:prolipoprotein diacylglycerol transferase
MLPVLFKIGSFPVHSYGVMLILGFLAGLWFAKKRAAKAGLNPAKVADMSFWALIAGVLGARIAFILQEWDYYSKNLRELFSWQFAGLTSFGGVIGGLALMIVWARRSGWPVRLVLDVIGPAGLLVHAIGRIGCLLNGCCYGGVCTLPWGIHVDHVTPLMHPAQIYDSLMNLAAIPLILWVEKRGTSRGQVFALTLVLHGLARFIYEFWRGGTEAAVKAGLASSTYISDSIPITQAQVVAAILVVIGLALYVAWRKPAYAQQELLAS